MKTKNILLTFGSAALLTLAAGCSSEYLDTLPTDSTSSAVLIASTENAKIAIQGLARLMHADLYGGTGRYGEGSILHFFGDTQGVTMAADITGSTSRKYPQFAYMIDPSASQNQFPWNYYYRVIANANSIINGIDEATGPESDKQFIKAQALTYRAYCFNRLAEIYCLRWVDSNNGSEKGLILRLEPSSDPMPRSTLADTYQQIYDDLDEAIRLFDASGQDRQGPDRTRTTYIMNKDVAYATYSRAALDRQDFVTAAQMADRVMANYPLMTVSEYNAGFNTPNQEWIWSIYESPDEDNPNWNYTYFGYVGYNSPNRYQVGQDPKMISKELWEQIPATDIRRNLFLKIEDIPDATLDLKSHFYQVTDAASQEIVRTKWGMPETSNIFLYMNLKIGTVVDGTNHNGCICLFRTSEMLLNKAEALYFQGGHDTEIQQLLEKLTRDTGRDPAYTCTKTGTDLWNEIKLYRAIELWGEGTNWFDLKRWREPRIVKTFDEGGNFIDHWAYPFQPDEQNRWVYMIPNSETNYNSLCEQNNY